MYESENNTDIERCSKEGSKPGSQGNRHRAVEKKDDDEGGKMK